MSINNESRDFFIAVCGVFCIGLTMSSSANDNLDNVIIPEDGFVFETIVTEEATAEESSVGSDIVSDTIDEVEEPKVNITHRYNYKVRGKHYKVFSNADNFQEMGIASWYGPNFHGKKTANGEKYNMNAMTAAHKTLPLGSIVKVKNLENGKKITVRINDRGPFHNGRIIDLSKVAAKRLGIIKKGSARVHVAAIN